MATRLDFTKINDRITNNVSSEEALKDVIPMEWSKDVVSGDKKVTVKSADKETETCVRLAISY